MTSTLRATIPETIGLIAGYGALFAVVAAEIAFVGWIWSWSAGA